MRPTHLLEFTLKLLFGTDRVGPVPAASRGLRRQLAPFEQSRSFCQSLRSAAKAKELPVCQAPSFDCGYHQSLRMAQLHLQDEFIERRTASIISAGRKLARPASSRLRAASRLVALVSPGEGGLGFVGLTSGQMRRA